MKESEKQEAGEPVRIAIPLPNDAGRPRGKQYLLRALFYVGLTALVVVMMLWLFGVFHGTVSQDAGATTGETLPDGWTTASVRLISVPRTEACSGRVTPVHEAEVASQVMAKVVSADIKAGQLVKKDQVLLQLDDTVLRSQLKQAEAALDAATSERNEAETALSRTRRLLETKVASQAQFDHDETVYKTAEANRLRAEQAVHAAKSTLAYTVITSPMDGTVIDKRVQVGDMAKPGQVLVTIYDEMQVEADVRESLIGRLHEGQPISVSLDRLGLQCEATVSEIIPEVDPAARTFRVKVVGQCHPGVRKGMYARVLVPLEPEKLLVLPPAAVREMGQLNMVLVKVGDRLQRRTVQLGRRIEAKGQAWVQVLSGLSACEFVAMPKSVADREAAHD
jgi:RND family efflux transporter MFP subunit